MTLSITHTTPADGTFSTTGAAAWDATHSLGGVADISQGGTNATTAAAARTNLGLGTIATQDANAVAITGGAISDTSVTVTDNVFTLQDNVDPTKQAVFQLSGLTTGTTFTYTLPAFNTTLAGLTATNTFTGTNNFGALNNSFGTYSGAATSNTNIASGAQTGTKTVNIGINGLSGSTTAITVGSANGSTTTMLGTTIIGGAAGNQSLQVNNVANAVNYAQIVGAIAGAAPTISAQGSDANISLSMIAKGAGSLYFGGTGPASSSFSVATVASSVDYLQVVGSTGGFPYYTASGASANINIGFYTKGTGNLLLGSVGGVVQARVSPTTSAVNYLNLTGAVTTAAPVLSAIGSDTDINIRFTPKGTGTVQFGTYTAGILAQAGFITITDAGGTSRRLLVG